MVPAVLRMTTKTLLMKYRPTCASVHAETYVSNENECGSANGRPRKISVLLLNEASKTQISGPAVASAQMASPKWARPLNALTSRRTSGLPPAPGVAGTERGACVSGMLGIGSPLGLRDRRRRCG